MAKGKNQSWRERFSAYTPKIEELDYENQFLLPWGVASMDIVLGGGICRGITRIFSKPGTGKSALAQMACAQAVAVGIPVLWVDAESRFDPIVARKNGMNDAHPLVNILYVHDEDGNILPYESIIVAIEGFIREEAKTSENGVLVVVDSLDACRTAAQLASVKDETITDANMASQAKINTNWMDSLTAILRALNSRVIFIQQLRDNMNPMTAKFEPTKTSGGNKLEYQTNIAIELVAIGTLAEGTGADREMIGREISAKIKKAPRGMGRRAKYNFLTNFGPDYIQSAIDCGLAFGLLTKSGHKLFWGETLLGKNEKEYRKYLVENPETYYAIYDQVIAHSKSGGVVPETSSDENPDELTELN